ncbi:hypothetical protein L484_023598 [Morus notabilis]|uniref:Uncharacterized protein n=1 Tax=Morus notabilis TaxID=981085 RepID=W9S5I2_9ROSA|nr:hypothetical protein L484_023598 [Morus notabilis]
MRMIMWYTIQNTRYNEALRRRCRTKPDVGKIPRHITLSTHKGLFGTTTIDGSFRSIEMM